MGLLDGKVALVTGARRGIGRAIALKFASEGASVVFTCRTVDDKAEAVKAEIEAFGVRSGIYSASDFDGAHKIVDDIKANFGRLDILVNNAGITQDGLVMRLTEEQWDAVIENNLKGAFNFIHAASMVMMRQRSGSIINVSSVVGIHGNAGQANYAASKAGLIGLTKSVAAELGARGVRCNAVAPGFIQTDMTAALDDSVIKEWTASIPLRRGGTPDDVAGVCLFLASDLAAYVSGEVIQVAGGMAM
jgi:3-oxoacyl-(acyl-carrier-protein) reductase